MLREKVAPDLGHVSMEVVEDTTGLVSAYVSYWPETDSLIGVTTHAVKPRQNRNPASYAQDSNPDDGYMQRPADFTITLHGLDEKKITTEWSYLYDSPYDFRHWNCSGMVKSLLLRAMSSDGYARVAPVADCDNDTLADVTDGADLLSRLRKMLISSVVECRPDDVLRVAAAYNGEDVEEIKAHRDAGDRDDPPVSLSDTHTEKDPALLTAS